MKTMLRSVLVLLAAAVLLAGCKSDDSSGSPDPGQTNPPPVHPHK